MKQKGLGRGLDAIFGSDPVDAKLKPMSQMAEIEIADIIPNPTQPRTQFDEEALDELADSIRQLGVIQPVTVKKGDGGKYVIISGERRWRAAQRADLKTLPAYIREVDDENLHAMALVENIQRQDLNAIEIALGMQRLIDECNLTQDALSEKVGKKRSSVSNYLRLLKLPRRGAVGPEGGADLDGTRQSHRRGARRPAAAGVEKVHQERPFGPPGRGAGPRALRSSGQRGTECGGRRVSRKLPETGRAARKVLFRRKFRSNARKTAAARSSSASRTTGTSSSSSNVSLNAPN